jgi:hypothetical protein
MSLCSKKPLESDEDGDGSDLKENGIHDDGLHIQDMALLNTLTFKRF